MKSENHTDIKLDKRPIQLSDLVFNAAHFIRSVAEGKPLTPELLLALSESNFVKQLLKLFPRFVEEMHSETVAQKIEYIRENSNRIIVLTGASGVGKTETMNHLVKTHGFINPPVMKTRKLRPKPQDGGPSEVELGHKSFTPQEFLMKASTFQFFLPMGSYGNMYAYDIDDIIQVLRDDQVLVIELPPSKIESEAFPIIPKATILAFVTDEDFSEKTLGQRATENDFQRKLRVTEGKAASLHVIHLCCHEVLDVKAIVPQYGDKIGTIYQVDKAINKRPELDRRSIRNITQNS